MRIAHFAEYVEWPDLNGVLIENAKSPTETPQANLVMGNNLPWLPFETYTYT